MRERLDRLLVARGLVETREKAQGLILAGRVQVDGVRVDKAGTRVALDATVDVVPGPRWVSRGAIKLEHALRTFPVPVDGRSVLDVGASTGGFTQALLAAGAARVLALDVGRGQLDWTLRQDPRVAVVEGVNARYLTPSLLPFAVTLACADVSFISLKRVLPSVAACLTPPGEIVALCKPQFEVGRGRVGRGGIVRDPAEHRAVLEDLCAFAAAGGLGVQGLCASPIRGTEGNAEFFLHLTPGAPSLSGSDLEDAVLAALASSAGDA
ncbi:MAG TPA: TlyA family RNA methyltransferase [Candidatus Polarisedimenticolaceae bacterium]|nr:TlyA family RNA methyltransferase [Candidatus Polarisedimenticolaceae bacterium]